ncbi:glutathione transferase GST 23-like [Euphorbia lathyris]|uniref:glutathione transferase GST 23-like n=1 Tax=Euphorbia lathyris TaxID=212925 RepID=UPI00331405E2
MTEEVKLLKTWSSPFGLRIFWALKAKGIQFESIDEDLTNKSPQLLEYNPIHKKIPVLIHNGKPIVESLVILEYIDETWTHNPLLPQHPLNRATARFLARFGDDKVMSSIWRMFTKQGKEQEEAHGEVIENLKYLEEELKGKRFFGGDEIGYVDVALGWLTNLIPVSEDILGFKVVDKQVFPSLSAWMDEFTSVPFVKESLPPHDKLILKFHAYIAASPHK